MTFPLVARPVTRRSWLAGGLLVLGVLAGCASAPTGPEALPLPVQVPGHWGEDVAQAQGAAAQAWWRDFGSPELDHLVQSALGANRDIRVAAARMAQARALVDGQQAAWQPQLGAVVGLQRGRDTGADPNAGRSVLGLRASWEIDVFDRGGLSQNAAQADAQGAGLAWQAARVALAADVSTAYFELRTLARRSTLGRDAAALAQRQLEVVRRRFEAGQATAVEVGRRLAELAQARANTAQIEGLLRVRRHQLALLLGLGEAPALALTDLLTLPLPPAPLLPSELLERRPDVQRQARALDAALGRVGVARRDLYPRLQIDWAGSRERLSIQGGSAAPQAVVGYGVSLTLPVLDGGRIRANIAVQEARAQEAMAEYEKAMLAALADAQASLVQWSAAEVSWREWQQAGQAEQSAAERAGRLFDAGMTDLGAVLDARLVQLHAEDAGAQAEGARWAAAVGLRRAFAGGV